MTTHTLTISSVGDLNSEPDGAHLAQPASPRQQIVFKGNLYTTLDCDEVVTEVLESMEQTVNNFHINYRLLAQHLSSNQPLTLKAYFYATVDRKEVITELLKSMEPLINEFHVNQAHSEHVYSSVAQQIYSKVWKPNVNKEIQKEELKARKDSILLEVTNFKREKLKSTVRKKVPNFSVNALLSSEELKEVPLHHQHFARLCQHGHDYQAKIKTKMAIKKIIPLAVELSNEFSEKQTELVQQLLETQKEFVQPFIDTQTELAQHLIATNKALERETRPHFIISDAQKTTLLEYSNKPLQFTDQAFDQGLNQALNTEAIALVELAKKQIEFAQSQIQLIQEMTSFLSLLTQTAKILPTEQSQVQIQAQKQLTQEITCLLRLFTQVVTIIPVEQSQAENQQTPTLLKNCHHTLQKIRTEVSQLCETFTGITELKENNEERNEQ